MKNIFKNISFYKIIFFSMPALFILLFGRFGFEDADTGFLIGLGWRIYSGEIPYVDFSYIRPPYSIFFSAALIELLPDFGQVIMIRFISYSLLLLSVLFAVSALDIKYSLENIGVNKYLLSTICFAISLSGFPPMLWHTIDGILLSSIAFYFLSKLNNKNTNYVLPVIATLFFCSVLAKQNFMVAPFLVIFYIAYEYGFKSMTKFILCFIALFVAFYIPLDRVGMWDAYVDATTSQTKVIDIYYSGIYPYIASLYNKWAISAAVCIIFFHFVLKRFNKTYASPLAVPIIFTVYFTYAISYGNGINFMAFKLNYILPLFISFYFVFAIFKNKLRDYSFLLLMLSLSWSVGISWGANSPLLFFTPVIYATIYIYRKLTQRDDKKTNYLIISFILTSILVTTSNLTPYRDSFITQLTYDMGDISKKTSFLKTDYETYSKYKELAYLDNKYDLKISTVLPSMPFAHYVNGKSNPFVMDWAMDTETRLDLSQLKLKLMACCKYVFLERKSVGHPIGNPGEKFHSSIAKYVVDNELNIEQGEYFDVFEINQF